MDELAQEHLTRRARRQLEGTLRRAAPWSDVHLLTDCWLEDDWGLLLVTSSALVFFPRDEDRPTHQVALDHIDLVQRAGSGIYAEVVVLLNDGTLCSFDEVGDEAWAHELVTAVDRLRGVELEEPEDSVDPEEPMPVDLLLEPDPADELLPDEVLPDDLLPDDALREQSGEEDGRPGYDGFAVAALVFGVFMGCGVTSLFALLLGKQAQQRIATSGARGSELASAAIVLGWIGVGLTALSIAFSLGAPALLG